MMAMARLHVNHRVVVASPHRRSRFSPSHLPILCILSLVALGSTSAFQSRAGTTHPSRRTTTTGVSSNKDPTPETLSSDEDGPPDAASDMNAASDPAGFGESVPYVPLSRRNSDSDTVFSTGSAAVEDVDEILTKNRTRNVAVALASFAVAIFNYAWQFAHPVTAVEILASMEKQSAPLTAIGNNGKPTVIDFWAPWCENCRVAAPTLQAVEEEYGDRVNFIMVNGDDGRNWPLIQLFGVDAIPHLALLSGEGDVETALIGPMSRKVLRADIDALLNKREGCSVEKEIVRPVCHDELPYKMFDAFGNRQDSRRINFVEQ